MPKYQSTIQKERTKKPHELLVPIKLDKILLGMPSIPKLGSVCRLDMGTAGNQGTEEVAGPLRAADPPYLIQAESRGLYIARIPVSPPRGTCSSHFGGVKNASLVSS